jgi:hypothetical protein
MSLDYAHLNVVAALPVSRFAPEGAEDVGRRLRGTTILRIGGTGDDVKIEGEACLLTIRPSATALRCSFSALTKMAYGWSMIHWRQSGRISKITVRRTPRQVA